MTKELTPSQYQVLPEEEKRSMPNTCRLKLIEMFKENRFGEKPIGTFNHGDHGRMEVIGNIYQHPELIK